MLKILQVSAVYELRTFKIYKLGLEKTKEPEIKLPTFAGSWEKQDNSPQILPLPYYVKAFVWITTNCGKLFKRWEY